MRRSTVLAATALTAALGVGSLLGATPAAGCSLAPEQVTASATEVDPGDTVDLTGSGIYHFVGPLGADCSGLESFVGTATIVLVPTEGADEVALGTVDVDADSDFAGSVTVPASTPAGTYTLFLRMDGDRYPSDVQLTVRGAPTTTVPPTTTPDPGPADPVPGDPTYTG